MGTYEQFRTVVGQYARFAIAARICSAKTFREAGMLCSILRSIKGVQAFSRSFQIRISACTVMNKAVHLIRLARYADGYFFQRKISESQGNIRCIVECLNSIASSNKNECRRQAALRKQEKLRDGSNKYLLPDDKEHFATDNQDRLKDIMNSCQSVFHSNGNDGVINFLLQNKAFLRKLKPSFLCGMIFLCGGQRSRVYTVLEAPSGIDYVSLEDSSRKTGA